MMLSTPHGDKLKALLQSPKLPQSDIPMVEIALTRYKKWLQALQSVEGNYQEIISQMVTLLNNYKQYIELDLIFDSKNQFLYRQKGQIKLDNTIIEEFLPLIVTTALAKELSGYELSFGPTTCFSGIRFESGITSPAPGGGLKIRSKNHDFAISRQLFIRASHDINFQESITASTNIAYIVAECKTNLDKTMFQESIATSLDIKSIVPGAKYYLLCEWLDMTPINTSTTPIDEIIILRKAKRLPANVRSIFNTSEGRMKNRQLFKDHLTVNPVAVDTMTRFLDHIREAIKDSREDDVLRQGYF